MTGQPLAGFILQFYYIQIIRHKDIAMIIFLGFGRIIGLARINMLVLGMVEHKIFHRQFLSQFAGFFYGAVVFLIGLEDIPVLVLAEGFGQQPVSLFRILSGMFVVGFIPQAGELQPISKFEFIADIFSSISLTTS